MALDGECFNELFFLIAENPIQQQVNLDLPSARTLDCCGDFSLGVLASLDTSDEYKNDVQGFDKWLSDIVVSAELKLYKHDGDDYTFLSTLTGTTYGVDFPFGTYTNGFNQKFIGYQVEWKKVLTLHGEGSYKIKCHFDAGLFGSNNIYEWPEICLKKYTPERADGTVRIEYYLNNIFGDYSNDKKKKDYLEINWYNSFRLKGFFGYPETPYTTEYVQYNDGKKREVEDGQDPEYILKLKPTFQYIHDIMRIEVMHSTEMLITDYNAINPGNWVKKSVKKASEYNPVWEKLLSKLASVEVRFTQRYNNLDKLNC